VSKEKPITDRSFQDLEDELSQLVEALEQPDTPLEQALADYERGIKVLREAQKRLDAAEQKVMMLSPDGSESSTLEPGDDEPE
jgi:exodeoxyribonuclease VII small subunit